MILTQYMVTSIYSWTVYKAPLKLLYIKYNSKEYGQVANKAQGKNMFFIAFIDLELNYSLDLGFIEGEIFYEWAAF